MKQFAALLLIILPLLSACSIKQTVEPAHIDHQARVCVVKNDKVREGFLSSLQEALLVKNIAYVVIEPNIQNPQCNSKITYTANWNWDLALYMSYAEINIYNKGELKGKATYDSRYGSGRLDKFISADEKVKELVNELIRVDQALLNPGLRYRAHRSG